MTDNKEQMNEEPKEFFLNVTGARDIKFIGWEIAIIPDEKNDNVSFKLYRTTSGKYICIKPDWDVISRTIEFDKLEIVHNTEEVINFFGYDNNAKKLYKQAGISDAIEIK